LATDTIHTLYILYEFQQRENAAKTYGSICSFFGENVSCDICAF